MKWADRSGLRQSERAAAWAPKVDPGSLKATFAALHEAIDQGFVRACHDLSEGGLAVAAAEMAFAGGLGARLFLFEVPHEIDGNEVAELPGGLATALLFAESNTRFLVEVPQELMGHFEEIMGDVPHAAVGEVIESPQLLVVDVDPESDRIPDRRRHCRFERSVAKTAALVNIFPLHAKAKQLHMQPRILILRAPGTNCDAETARAFQLAGGQTDVMHVRRLLESPRLLNDYQVFCIPGGFSYGDDIASGRIFGVQLQNRLADAMQEFKAAGKLIFGICNGFQVLVKCGLLSPDDPQLDPAMTPGLEHVGQV